MRARKEKTIPEWQAYRNHVKSYKYLLKQTKRKAWRDFCAKGESVHEKARMNRILKNCDGHKNKLETIIKPDNTYTQSPEETLDVLTDAHFKEAPNVTEWDHPHPVATAESLIKKVYEPSRITKAVRTFEPEKAAGPDNIQPIILQKAWDHISDITRRLLVLSHKTQHIPKPWTESTGIFLAKPGKTDYTRAKSYRMITPQYFLNYRRE